MIAAAVRRVLASWERLERDAAAERAAHPGLDRRALAIMVVAALVLVAEDYYGDQPTYRLLFAQWTGALPSELGALSWWAGAKVVGYLLIPLGAVKLMGGRAREFGLGAGAWRQHAWIYLALFVALLPVLIAASGTPAFLAVYPFFRNAANWRALAAWELLYAATFLSLEFFFRGFLLFGLRRAMGPYAIFAMAIPYCMIHFGKPVVEVVAAIFAGIVLGTLALITESIWCGVVLHVGVAWTMDLLAIAHAKFR